MSIAREFEEECRRNARAMAASEEVAAKTMDWMVETARFKYTYNFTWLGRPIIQLPTDVMALQEIIWRVRPELIIETGVAHGGSLVFYASMLELIGHAGRVVGVEIDVRLHNRAEVERHPMAKRIEMIQGSSTDDTVMGQVRERAAGASIVMVVLDSNHTHEHVARELELYSPLVSVGSYLVVLDTIIEDMPGDTFPDRAWGRGNNPKTAVWEFLRGTKSFEIDREIQDKLLLTVAPDGYLKRVQA